MHRAHQSIGANLRRARNGRSQTDVGNDAGVAQSVISRIERGNYTGLTIEMVLRLSVAVDAPPSDLLRGMDDAAVIARFEAGK